MGALDHKIAFQLSAARNILWLSSVLKKNRPDVNEIPGDFKPYLATLLQNCWETDYKARPTFDTIVTTLENEEFTPCTAT